MDAIENLKYISHDYSSELVSKLIRNVLHEEGSAYFNTKKNIQYAFFNKTIKNKNSISFYESTFEENKLKEHFYENIFVIKNKTIKEYYSNSPLKLNSFKVGHLSVKERTDLTTRQEFSESFSKLRHLFKEGLRKGVLHRSTMFHIDGDISNLVERLFKVQGNHYQSIFHKNNQIWISVTPETLVKKEEERYQIDILAGTALKGEEDSLLNSEKDLSEHNMVLEQIKERLHGLELNFKDAPEIKTFGPIIHLHNLVNFQSNLNSAEIFDLIHPTPAVGILGNGYDHRILSSIEKMPRDNYCGVLGIKDMLSGLEDIAVNIRCACYNKQNSNLIIYAGAGITPDSEESKEWQEMENKMVNFLNILT